MKNMYNLRYLPGKFKDGKKIGYIGDQQYTITKHKEKVPGLCKKVYSEYWLWESNIESIFPREIDNIIDSYVYPKYMLRNIPFHKDNTSEYDFETELMKKEDWFDKKNKAKGKKEFFYLLRYPEHLREYLLNNDDDTPLDLLLEFCDGDENNIFSYGLTTFISLFVEKHSDYFEYLMDNHHGDGGNTINVLYWLCNSGVIPKESPYTSYALKTYWGDLNGTLYEKWHDKMQVLDILCDNFPPTERDKAYILESYITCFDDIYQISDISRETAEFYLEEATIIHLEIVESLLKLYPESNIRKLYRKDVFEEFDSDKLFPTEPDSEEYSPKNFFQFMAKNYPPSADNMINIYPHYNDELLQNTTDKDKLISFLKDKIKESEEDLDENLEFISKLTTEKVYIDGVYIVKYVSYKYGPRLLSIF